MAGRAWTIIAKHERGGSLLQWLLSRLGRNPLRQEFVTGWKCLHRELPAALPLAILTRGGASRQESILLVEYIPDSQDLDTFCKLHLPEMPAGAGAAAEAADVRRAGADAAADVDVQAWRIAI